MELLKLIGFILTSIFLMIFIINFLLLVLNKVRISKYREGLEMGEKEHLSIIAMGSPLDVFRLLDRTPIVTETSDNNLTEYILMHKSLKKRIKVYGILIAVVYLTTILIVKTL